MFRFSTSMWICGAPKTPRELGKIIGKFTRSKVVILDLTNKNFYSLVMHCQLQLTDIPYKHFFIEGRSVPTSEQWVKIKSFIDTSLAKNRRVLIHCTNGVHRSGAVALKYLCETDPELCEKDALRKYEATRGELHTKQKAWILQKK